MIFALACLVKTPVPLEAKVSMLISEFLRNQGFNFCRVALLILLMKISSLYYYSIHISYLYFEVAKPYFIEFLCS